MNDQVMQFVAYSNVNIEKVKENSPRAAEKSGFQIASLAGQVKVQPNSFVDKLKAKGSLAAEGNSSVPAGGLFGGKQKAKAPPQNQPGQSKP